MGVFFWVNLVIEFRVFGWDEGFIEIDRGLYIVIGFGGREDWKISGVSYRGY